MRFGINFFFGAIVILSSLPGLAAETVECRLKQIGSYGRSGQATRPVRCQNIYDGKILDDQKVEQVLIRIKRVDGSKETVIISEADQKASMYYGQMRLIDKASKALKIPPDQIQSAELDSFIVLSDVQLFEDDKAEKKIPNPFIKADQDSYGRCRYVNRLTPMLPPKNQTDHVMWFPADKTCLEKEKKKNNGQFKDIVPTELPIFCSGNVVCPNISQNPKLVACAGFTEKRCPSAADCRDEFIKAEKEAVEGKLPRVFAEEHQGDVSWKGGALHSISYKGACVINYGEHTGAHPAVPVAGRIKGYEGNGLFCSDILGEADKCFPAERADQIMPEKLQKQEPGQDAGRGNNIIGIE